MKKTFLLLVTFLCTIATVWAQEKSHKLVFINTDGTVVKDGATLILNKVETSVFEDGMINSGLSVRNTSNQTLPVMLSVNITEITGGALQVCFPSSCDRYTTTGLRWRDNGELSANAANEAKLQTEFFLNGDDRCKATLQLFTAKQMAGTWVADEPQATVTLIFDKNTTNIRRKGTDNTVYYNIFSLQGQQIEKHLSNLNNLNKGIYIIEEISNNNILKSYKRIVR